MRDDADPKIGDVAQHSGLTVDALRYYERQGLFVGSVERNTAGHRVYRDVDFDWLAICKRLRHAGVSVTSLRRYADLVRAGSGNERERLAVLRDERASAYDAAREIDEALELLDRKITDYEVPAEAHGPSPEEFAAASPSRAGQPDGRLLGEVDPARGIVTLRRAIPADATAVWRVLTDPEHLGHWLGRVADGAPGPGATFTIWHDEETQSTHEVLTWEPDRALRYSWYLPDEGPSTVAFDLSDGADGATLLTLVHSDVADAARYAAGWHRHLDYLVADLTGTTLPPGHFWDGYEDLVARYATTARE